MYSHGMFDLEQTDCLLSLDAPVHRIAQERLDLQHVESIQFVENDVLPETVTVGRNNA